MKAAVVKKQLKAIETPKPVLKPAKSTPKFQLLATSVHRSRPERSIALITEPGKEAHWIRQGQRIDYFTIHEIKSGSIVVRDDDRFDELAMAPISDNTKPNVTGPDMSNVYAMQDLNDNRRSSSSGKRASRQEDSSEVARVYREMTPLSPRFRK